MKKILPILFSTVIFFLSSLTAFGQEATTPPSEDMDCIDLEAIYTEVNNSSHAITGVSNSLDAVKKANTVASLLNVVSLFLGDQIYCVKDEEIASQSSTLKSTGLLGLVDEANKGMYALFPDINVSNHLAKMWVPGYDEKNSLQAQSIDFGGSTGDQADSQDTANEVSGFIEGEINNTVGEALGGMEAEEYEVVEAGATNVSGYTYLKDIVHLDTLWGISSGFAYVSFVIVFMVVGFMIMFRKNLPGDVTVTISRALPKLIMSLVLVTFSFAIVGLIMDMGRLGINLSRHMFNSAYSQMSVPDPDIIEVKNLWGLADDVFKKTRMNPAPGDALQNIPVVGPALASALFGTGNSIGGELARVGVMGGVYYFLEKGLPHIIDEADIDTGVQITAQFFVGGSVEILEPIVTMVSWMLKTALHTASTGAKIALIATIVKSLLLIIISFYAAIKVFITLLSTYLKLFLNVILGPLQIMLGAIPGNSHLMTNWFKSVVANTLVFVGVFIVINAFNLISKSVDPSKFNFFGNSGTIWPDILISLEGVIVIAGYLFAANIPKIINGVLGVQENQNVLAATEDIKNSVKKIPLIGGMFG